MKRTNQVTLAVAVAIAAPCMVSAQTLDEITVTGSRISQNGMATPTPVTAVGAAELEQMSPGTLIDGLNQLPQFFGNTTSEQANGGQNSGGSNVNLRGAGINRTLVLLDGRRVVSSNRFGTVDVNMFPDALLRGVETVTGGASASYGTDAVAGVVNFLLDTKFTGVKLHAQGGETSRRDGRNSELSIAFGHAFGEKINLIGSYGQFNQNAIKSFESLRDRPWFSQASRVTNPTAGGPAEIIRLYVSPTDFTNSGVIVEAPLAATNPQAATLNPILAQLNRLEFLGDGTTRRLPFSGVGNLNAGCKCFASSSQNYGVDGDTEVANSSSRENAFLHLTYDLSDALELYAQGMYGNTRTSDRRESVALLSVWEGRIYSDNAYLPANVRTIVNTLPANRRYFGFGVFLPNNEDNPMGDSRQVTDNRMHSFTVGFKSKFASGFLEGWSMDGYYQYGENRQDFITQNGIRVDRLPMAMDAVVDPNGNTVCRVSLAQFDPTGIFKDCAPINLFGGVKNITPQAAAWIRDDGKIGRQEVSQHVAELVLSGDIWRGIGAGPFAAAFGASWRKDDLNQFTVDQSDEFPGLPDGTLLSSLGILPASLRGVVPQGENGGVAGYTGIPGLRFVPGGFKGDANSSSVLFSSLRTIAGGYNVKEAFGELQIPLLENVGFAKRLEVNTAARWANYSGSGNIWAWKLGVNWEINDQIRLRATRSRDVRAATLQERFDQTRGGVNVTDPANGNALVTTASFSGGNPN
ncbi:MAG: TonB-dependent receptor, partial [Pseudomonadota bacterium]